MTQLGERDNTAEISTAGTHFIAPKKGESNRTETTNAQNVTGLGKTGSVYPNRDDRSALLSSLTLEHDYIFILI